MKKKSCLLSLVCIMMLTQLTGCTPTTSQNASQATARQPQKIQAPAIQPDSEALSTQGLQAYQQFEYDKAIALYDKAIDADSNNYKAYSGKGIAMAMRGNETGNKSDISSGIAYIQKALSLYPDYVPTFYDLALACKINGQYEIAIQYFQKVIDAEPDNTWSYYGIATIYGDKGQAKEAVSYLKKAIALDPQPVKEAARTQSHFDKIRNNADFQALIQ